MFLSMIVLVLSLITSFLVFKSSMSSWIAFVTILTFSSGMMTLFMYTASLSSNEKSKTKKLILPLFILSIIIMVPNMNNSSHNNAQSMKMFSSLVMLMVMAIMLIITMMALSLHGHHPNQTVSSSF